MSTRGPKPKGKTPRAWSPEVAYAVGLIATDGSLSKDGRHIDFTSAEIKQINTFKKCLDLKIKTGKKKSGAGLSAYRVQISDVLFYRWLEEVGLHPNKSKTIGPVAVPDQYFRDFLRGCFDGDGSTHGYWDKRWKNSWMFYITFCSASPMHLHWLQSQTQRLSGISGHIANLGSISGLRFAKQETRILYKFMYYRDNLPRLKRKQEKTLALMAKDPYHTETSTQMRGW